ncbi:MAG TPA: PilZ domain-containing protein [Alphaproteobacteria bacterium]
MALGDAQAQDVKERRTHPRDTVVYGGRLAYGAHEYPCTVLNISAGGAQLRFGHEIGPWTIVTLHVDRFGSFHARVVWQRGDRVGLQFLEDAVLVTRRIVGGQG